MEERKDDSVHCDLQKRVFQNHLIGHKISSYLRLEDMRMASLVCKSMHIMVRDSSNFTASTSLRLDCPLSKLSTSENLKLSSLCWGSLVVDISLADKFLKFFEDNDEILHHILQLRLTMSRKNSDADERKNLHRGLSTSANCTAHAADVNSLFKQLSQNCNKVSELQVDLEILTTCDVVQFMTPLFVNQLTDLEIVSNSAIKDESLDLLKTNLDLYFSSSTLSYLNLTFLHHSHSCLVKLITSNNITLEVLELSMSRVSDLVFPGMILPHLKRIKVEYLSQTQSISFVEFFCKQPNLEQLHVEFDGECSSEFLYCLQKKSEILNSLYLSANYFENGVNWSFLSRCSKIDRFTIIRNKYTCRSGEIMRATGVTFLENLPSYLTHLCFRRIEHFWEQGRRNRRQQIPDQQIVNLLSQFPYMRSVDFWKCGEGTVTDLVMQTIIKQMPRLRVLKISHADCTDTGLTGVDLDGQATGLSLIHLTELNHVTINKCSAITSKGIIASLKHITLDSFEFISNNEITTTELWQFAQQNECLTRMIVFADLTSGSLPELMRDLTKTRHWKKLDIANDFFM